ncbi:hypothetical protein FOVG_00823 [Fusarium oxysporum f. sp. pisi HDV247]|uniref:Uncharacterized protein n=2 Tax=Fusarium oxysporum TaxID=5507 RepID=X0LPE3_FUSOX|nr:hypothetical protein FOVG_00823 [Fusarium oxysporum f. sp. pisi HDV247]EXM27768.1 hypothetical protein FOTG_06119 [Fusarium oxysporum f. sp. vasinfectum 25433]
MTDYYTCFGRNGLHAYALMLRKYPRWPDQDVGV